MKRPGTIRPGRWRQRPRVIALAAALLAVIASDGASADSRVLIVSGLGGDSRFEDSFYESATTIYDAALASGVAQEAARLLTEDPERDSERPIQKSTRDNVLAALDELIAGSEEGDDLWLVLIGHGSFRDGTTRINLPGPDLTDRDLAARLTALEGRRVVVVNTTSSSGGMLETLAGPGRVVVTATKSAAQRNETRFGPLFASALRDLEADEDKNERVSLLEAFRFATREVGRYYETEKLLRTEQALLDDNGDGAGSAEPDSLGGEDGAADGMIAAQLHFEGSAESGKAGEVAVAGELGERRRELARQLVELRRQKGALGEEVYQAELERILLEIAEIDQRLQAEGEAANEAETGSSDTGRTPVVPETLGEPRAGGADGTGSSGDAPGLRGPGRGGAE